jgi:uncharacterized membrane protein YfcA
MYFEIAQITVSWWIPPLVAFVIALVVSTGGLSGAFVLLPFQVSILGFTAPSVTATNHLYNVVSIPGGIYRMIREKRMVWPLTIVIVCGTLPGVAVGSFLRVRYLTDAELFKLFAGFVLLLISARLLWDTVLRPIARRYKLLRLTRAKSEDFTVTPVTVTEFSLKRLRYTFSGQEFGISVPVLFVLSAIVGLMGGAYGVGGGAIIAPFLITVFGLPVYTTAGATFFGTCATSAFAVVFYSILAPMYASAALPIMPDWKLGVLFGLGGFLGIYTGARVQKFISQRVIKTILGVGITSIALRYILGYFF